MKMAWVPTAGIATTTACAAPGSRGGRLNPGTCLPVDDLIAGAHEGAARVQPALGSEGADRGKTPLSVAALSPSSVHSCCAVVSVQVAEFEAHAASLQSQLQERHETRPCVWQIPPTFTHLPEILFIVFASVAGITRSLQKHGRRQGLKLFFCTWHWQVPVCTSSVQVL